MASAAALAKQANGLVTLYVNLWADKYNDAPAVNRHRDKWGFQDMVEDLGYDRAKEVITYYFQTGRPGHPLKHLLMNYDRLHKLLLEIEQDEIDRVRLRKETEQRVKEWEEKNGD